MPTPIFLEEHEQNDLPALHNWSPRYPGLAREDGAVLLLLASTSAHLGTQPHQRVSPAATTVMIPLDEGSIRSLRAALEEAEQILADNRRDNMN